MYAYDFILCFALAEGNPYLNDLFWLILFYNDRLTISHYELVQLRVEVAEQEEWGWWSRKSQGGDAGRVAVGEQKERQARRSSCSLGAGGGG
jgi:hypothetical protein